MSNSTDLIGTHIGNFKVTSHLGAGGMGDVFIGWDQMLERKVALKAIKAEHRLDHEAKERFLREARVLSKLKHNNICQIYDYIEQPDADYLVLELIEGQSLRDAMRGEIDERSKMRIAEQMCAVLVAVHEQGVVHRDLKPDNVMLTTDGLVKVLDFGLSRSSLEEAVRPDVDRDPVSRDPVSPAAVADDQPTRVMAPEIDSEATAALPSRSRLDPEATAALPPATAPETSTPEPTDPDSTKVLPASDVQTRSESADPDSTHLLKSSSSAAAVGLTTVGTIMGTLGYMSPEQAKGELAGAPSDMYSFGLILQELMTGRPAVDRVLELGPLLINAQRGVSLPVEGIGADHESLINRLKALAPASRPSALDTAERLAWIRDTPARQRKRQLRIAGIAALALFSVAMGIQSWRATKANARAQVEADRAMESDRQARAEAEAAQQVSDFLIGIFQISDPGEARGAEVTARELLDKGAEEIETDLQDQPLIRARMMGTMGKVYRRLGLYPDAERLLRSALAIREEVLGPQHIVVGANLNNLGVLLNQVGRPEEAEEILTRSIRIQENALGADHLDVANALNTLGASFRAQGRPEEAASQFLRSIEIRERILGPKDIQVTTGLVNLAITEADLGRLSEAEALYRRALALQEETLGADHPQVATVLGNLGELLASRGRLEEAGEMLERALASKVAIFGEDHPDIAYTLDGLALLERKRGNHAESDRLYRQSIEILQRTGDIALPYVLEHHADLLREMGDDGQAAGLADRGESSEPESAEADDEDRSPASSADGGP